MFARQSIVVCMAALVLLCPYLPCRERCDACGLGVAEAYVDESPEAHSCCSHCELDRPRPAPVGEECPLGGKLLNCFCGGAVVARSVECPDVDHAVFDLIPHGLAPALATHPMGLHLQTARAPDSGCHFPPLASGRDIRDLAVSYLL